MTQNAIAEADAIARQKRAKALGLAAEKQGLPVIYIHGHPYQDPDFFENETQEPADADPFAWDLWTGER